MFGALGTPIPVNIDNTFFEQKKHTVYGCGQIATGYPKKNGLVKENA